MSWLGTSVVATLAVCLCLSVSHAKPPTAGAIKEQTKAHLVSGLRCFEELNYGCTIKRLSAVREALVSYGVSLSKDERRSMLRTLGFALSSVEKHAEAQDVFLEYLRTFPRERLDGAVVSPKIMNDFRAARATFLAELMPLNVQSLPPTKPFVGTGPSARDLVLHVPEELRLASRVRRDEEIVHTIGFEAGAGLLFGADSDNFATGFAVGLTYHYEVAAPLQVGLRLGFGQHGTSRSDVKAGYPSKLLAFHGGPEFRVAFELGDYVELAMGVAPSIHTSGVGTLGEKIGGMIMGSLTVMARPVTEIGIGVAVLPSVVLASTENGLGSSFVLPVSLRLEGAF